MLSKEFTEWQAYWSLEPFGPLTNYERTGILASQVVNVGLGKVVTKPSDFMPVETPPEPEDEGLEQVAGDVVKQAVIRSDLDNVMASWGGKRDS